METTTLEVVVSSQIWDDHAPTFQIEVNGKVESTVKVTEKTTVTVVLNDEVDNNIKLSLINKTSADTVILNNVFEKDILLMIDDVILDGVGIMNIMYDSSTYTHNFNGTGEQTTGKFTGVMGCNGHTEINITTPAYLWLLENT